MNLKTIAVLVPLALAGCVSPGPGPSPISVLPENVQAAIQASCGLVLTADSLSNVIGAFVGLNIGQYTAIAANICANLKPTAGRAGNGGTVYVGRFRGKRIVAVPAR